MIPGWLRARLMDAGEWSSGGYSRAARGQLCADCGALVLAGLDGDVAALGVRADPEPLSPTGEALAILTGLATFALHRAKNGFELTWRDGLAIRGAPAGSGRYDVLAEHRCGSAELPGCPSAYPEPTGSAPDRFTPAPF